MQSKDKPRASEPQCDDIPWKCIKCRTLLAYIDRPTQTALRIKVRDVFWWIVDPALASTACRVCGAYNERERKK